MSTEERRKRRDEAAQAKQRRPTMRNPLAARLAQVRASSDAKPKRNEGTRKGCIWLCCGAVVVVRACVRLLRGLDTWSAAVPRATFSVGCSHGQVWRRCPGGRRVCES